MLKGLLWTEQKIQALLLFGCVPLSEIHTLCEPQFLHLQKEDNNRNLLIGLL